MYCGVNETRWNKHPVMPGRLACVAPVYGNRKKLENRVRIPKDTKVMVDSGAFCDEKRLSVAAALERQVTHADKYDYWYQVSEVVSYDWLIDEKWIDGVRVKERWSTEDAKRAVDETVKNAEFLVEHRFAIPNYPYSKIILSVQGVDAGQYLDCAKRVVRSMSTTKDVLGMGGWCIIGKMPKKMMPVFIETVRDLIPALHKSGVKRVHIFGVLYAPALGYLLYLCNQCGIKLSTDSAGPQFRPTMGVWGYMGWRNKNYKRAPVETRGYDRARHVRLTRDWLRNFERTKFYRPLPNKQFRMFT